MSSSTSQNTTPASSDKQVLPNPLSSHPVTTGPLNREDAVVGMLEAFSLDSSEETVPQPGPLSSHPITTGHLHREDAVVGMLDPISLDPSDTVPQPRPQRLRPAAAAKVEQGGLPSPSIVVESALGEEDGDEELLLMVKAYYDADARPVDLGLLRSGSWTHEEFERP